MSKQPTPARPISPLRAATCLTESWSPRVIAEFDDHYVKVARLEGDFECHAHPNEDELFYVLQGCLHIELPDGQRELGAGDLFVVPRGVRHRPSARSACLVLLIEQRATAHAGDTDSACSRSLADQLRPIEGLHATRGGMSATDGGSHPERPDQEAPGPGPTHRAHDRFPR